MTQAVVNGIYTYTYSYTAGTHADGYNAWKGKVVETRPDGSTYTVYTNYLGQVLLADLSATEDSQPVHWYSSRVYGESSHNAGMLVQVAEPSAISGYTATTDTLTVTLHASAGAITQYTYYSSTTATETTAGGVAGYLQYSQLLNGTGDTTPVTVSLYDYYVRTVGSGAAQKSLCVVADMTAYQNDDQTGDTTTSYAYTWYTDTLQTQQITTTFEAVATAQNGSGTAAVTYAYYNSSGQLTWSQNALGRVSYYAYDAVTGLRMQAIADVDAGRGLTAPTGWTLPTDGQHVVTDYAYDSAGTLTQALRKIGVRLALYTLRRRGIVVG